MAMSFTHTVAESLVSAHDLPLAEAAKNVLATYAVFGFTHCGSPVLVSPAAPASPEVPPPPPLSLLHAPTESVAAVTETKSVMKRRIRPPPRERRERSPAA